MREILFRGKQLNNGKWVYGVPLKRGESVIMGEWFSECDEYLCYSVGVDDIYDPYVAPDTVGQCTGLTDKNGKKIFEGDIVRHYNIDELPEEFEIGKIFFSEEQCCFKRTCNTGFSSCYISADCKYEVIGNIYDNPELLEVED